MAAGEFAGELAMEVGAGVVQAGDLDGLAALGVLSGWAAGRKPWRSVKRPTPLNGGPGEASINPGRFEGC
ncbi:hypothetical protein TPA0910_12360 [Streptomyces hygroscopicus subsp. sporocinereus]|uniref:Uncharacterized protein n=1 Tax=Streptomyces hygroscopicus TaxID=1912 RepID=A0ABQ3TU62_STRHY|nr:hypothetical protein [Streptomyces hygroscopicus]GHJ26803.1 hypothetical protein TPA0910_12360 [Streptomyces hygroscopicus]